MKPPDDKRRESLLLKTVFHDPKRRTLKDENASGCPHLSYGYAILHKPTPKDSTFFFECFNGIGARKGRCSQRNAKMGGMGFTFCFGQEWDHTEFMV